MPTPPQPVVLTSHGLTVVAMASASTHRAAQRLVQRALDHVVSLCDADPEATQATLEVVGLDFLVERGADGRWQLLAPDLQRDPLAQRTPDLSGCMALIAMQLSAVARVGVAPWPTPLDALVSVAPGTVEAPSVMCARLPQPGPDHSGWHLRPSGDLTTYDHDYVEQTVASLLTERMALLWPLALQPDLIARVEGDALVSVIGRDGVERYAR